MRPPPGPMRCARHPVARRTTGSTAGSARSRTSVPGADAAHLLEKSQKSKINAFAPRNWS